MIVKNFKCEFCKNASMCSGFKTISKFSEDHSRNPLVPDITMDDCINYAWDESCGDENTEDYSDKDATITDE